jgi:3,4-dihydroxy 2-butanone 4-phosphate synthase / GTP cyclohydrolase II
LTEAVELSTIDEAVAATASGRMVVVVDDRERENEGDLVMAAEKVTPEAINFMSTHGKGLICVPMMRDRLEALGIPPMVADNTDLKGTAFMVTVDYRHRTTTGISAYDRAATIRALIDPASRPEDFTRPGHTFPLCYREGGVLKRAGHTEASIDLTRMAGLYPAGVICEIVREDGEMARLPDLLAFCAHHDFPVISIADLIDYRRRSEKTVRRVAEARLPLAEGEFSVIGYEDLVDGRQHLALVMGDVRGADGVLVRVHSECLTGDVFGSERCDCGAQLALALRKIADEGCGVIVYLRGHEGRGIGLLQKIHAYRLQDGGMDTVEANLTLGQPADRRDYGTGMQILADLGIHRMRLLTNNPSKRAGLEGYGLSVVERVPLVVDATAENLGYLRAKRDKLGHLLDGIETFDRLSALDDFDDDTHLDEALS